MGAPPRRPFLNSSRCLPPGCLYRVFEGQTSAGRIVSSSGGKWAREGAHACYNDTIQRTIAYHERTLRLRSWQWLAVCWRFGRTCAPLPETPEVAYNPTDVLRFENTASTIGFGGPHLHRDADLRGGCRKGALPIQMAGCAHGDRRVTSTKSGWLGVASDTNESRGRKSCARKFTPRPRTTRIGCCGPGVSRDRDSGSPCVVSQQPLGPMAIMIHLGAILAGFCITGGR